MFDNFEIHVCLEKLAEGKSPWKGECASRSGAYTHIHLTIINLHSAYQSFIDKCRSSCFVLRTIVMSQSFCFLF